MQRLIKKWLSCLLVVLACVYSVSALAAAKQEPLPTDKAFALTVSFIRPDTIMATWHIAPGYYLYAKRISFRVEPSQAIADVRLPKGKWKEDSQEGNYEVFAGTLDVPVSLKTDAKQVTLNVMYQGCAEDGFCYPPTQKNFMLNATNLSVVPLGDMRAPSTTTSLWALMTDQNGIKTILQGQHIAVLLLIFVGIGILLAFTPCVLPMVPILTSIIVGQQHARGSKKAFLLSLTYVLGMSITYAGAGLLAASFGSSIQIALQKPWTIILVSLIFILLAFSLFGLYELRFSRRWHNWISVWSNRHQGGTYLGVFFMGALATLVVSPCVTAPLVGVLIYIGQTGNLVFGASALFAMGIGMGIPLLLIGMSADRWLPKSGAWMKAVKEMFGIFMVAMAIWLLARVFPVSVITLLSGLLLIGTAAYIGLYLPRLIRFRKTNRTIGLGVALFGMMVVMNGFSNIMTSNSAIPAASSFVVVDNMADLDKQLSLAQTANRPVMLDFYADWCQSCVTMERAVFAQNNVQQALDNFMLIRVDLSKNTEDDANILKRYNVIAPPTVLFFNTAGIEVNSRRIVGELDENEFLMRLNSFKTASCDTKQAC